MKESFKINFYHDEIIDGPTNETPLTIVAKR